MPVRLEEWAEAEERLRHSVLGSFRTQPQIAKQEHILHGPLDRREGDKIRLAVTAALKAGLTIGDAERSALQPLGPDQWNEASQQVESHLDTPLAIPDRDLEVYVSQNVAPQPPVPELLEDQVAEVARLAQETLEQNADPEQAMREEIEAAIQEKQSLQSRIPEGAGESDLLVEADIEAEPESVIEHDLGLAAAIAIAAQKAVTDSGEPSAEVVLSPADAEPVQWDLAAAMDPSRLTPLPLVAAALEAVGLDEEHFGFLLRYGTLAPEGRASEIKITGLGMAEFSNRAAEWFKALGASKFPIQVIDDGSGALTVYLLASVPA